MSVTCQITWCTAPWRLIVFRSPNTLNDLVSIRQSQVIKPKSPALQMDSLPLSHKESRGPVSPTHITLILYISEVFRITANSYLLNLFTWGLYLTNKIFLLTSMVIWQWQWYNNCTLRRGILNFHLFSWAPKSPWMVTATMKLKDTSSLEKKLW